MGNKLQDKACKLAELPYAVKVEKDKKTDGKEIYLAIHPELIGCMSQGATVEEAMDNLKEVTEEYIASLLEDGLPVPAPMTKATSTTQETITVSGTFSAPTPRDFPDLLSEVIKPSTRQEVATVEPITC